MIINCPDCGEVTHIPIGDDERHCPCLVYFPLSIDVMRHDGVCGCDCHKVMDLEHG